MEEYGCNCSFDSAGNPVDWCSFHEALRDSLAEKDKEIERLKAALNEIATTELICPEMKEKCEYMSDIALKALKEEGDGSTV